MPLLEMRNIVKEFPGVRALDGVSFTLNVCDFMQDIINGSILVAAVGLDMMGRKQR